MPRLAPETRLHTAAEVGDWFRTALPDELFTYCTGPRVPEGPTKAYVAALTGDGSARAHMRRGQGGVLEHYVVKRAEPARREIRSVAPVTDPVRTALLHELAAAATAGRRCPSDAELARAAGLESRHAANWRLRKLAESNLISIETFHRSEGPWRVVTVGGRSTAPPPARRARA